MGQILDIVDVRGTSGMDNNADGKNAYTKADFSTDNVGGANVDGDASIGAGDISGTGDAGGTGSKDNNVDSKNAYAKADFSNYNVASTNAGANMGNTSVTSEKVSNNTKNTGVG